jgi:hypothetical protein
MATDNSAQELFASYFKALFNAYGIFPGVMSSNGFRVARIRKEDAQALYVLAVMQARNALNYTPRIIESALQPQFINNCLRDIVAQLGSVDSDGALVFNEDHFIQAPGENFPVLDAIFADRLRYFIQKLAIHIDNVLEAPTKLSVWADIFLSTAWDTAAGVAKKILNTAEAVGKGVGNALSLTNTLLKYAPYIGLGVLAFWAYGQFSHERRS